MLRKTAIISFTLVMVMSFSSYGVLADEFGSVPVDIDNDYIDSNADAWNCFVVWERGLDLNDDGVIHWAEPSWIMIHDITSGESWNITQEYEVGVYRYSTTYYYHAKYPEICGDKVIYRYYTLLGSTPSLTATYIGMYNITRGETWDRVPIPSDSGYNYGTISIYDKWIFSSDGVSKKEITLYNYETTEQYFPNLYRPNTGVMNFEHGIFNNYIAWSDSDSSNIPTVFLLNLDNYNCIQINVDDDTRFCDISHDTLVFKVTHSGVSDLYAYNLLSINWTSVLGNMNSPTPYEWSDIEGNVTNIIVDNSIDTEVARIWINYVYYQNIGEADKIYKYDINKNRTEVVIDIPYTVKLGDIHFDKVVWTDDRAGEFNVYRLTTNIEAFNTILILSIPLIMIGVVVVLFWKAFSGIGGGMS